MSDEQSAHKNNEMIFMCCLIQIFIFLQITNNYLYIESIYYKFTFDAYNEL